MYVSRLDIRRNQLLTLPGFDRDLGVAGRVMTRASNGSIVQKLVKVDRPSMFFLLSQRRLN